MFLQENRSETYEDEENFLLQSEWIITELKWVHVHS